MRAREFIIESLKPSEYRSIVKNWDNEKFADIFNSGNFKTDRKGYRIYLPLKKSTKKIEQVPVEIQNALSEKGYEIADYKTGLAKEKNGKRVMKIGKLLPLELQQKFANDKTRQAQGSYMVVISRHPYDIAGMSTNRGWTSCMNLKDGINKHYIPIEVKEGTIVAYLVKTTDTDIKNPVARISIKPFIEENTSIILFGAESTVYGTDVSGFKQTVKSWIDQVNKTRITPDMVVANKSGIVHDDSRKRIIILSKDEQIKNILSKPYSIRDIKNPSKEAQLAAVRQKPDSIKFINDPSEDVQLAAVTKNGQVIEYIKNPSEDVQLAAVKRSGWAIGFIKSPSEKVQLAAVSLHGGPIKLINDPSEDVQLAAVTKTGHAIEYIKNPSEDVQLAAVSNSPGAIGHLNNPSEKVQLTAVTKNGLVIKYIKNPSKQVQLAAKRNNK